MHVSIFVTKRMSKFMECFYIILLYCGAILLIFSERNACQSLFNVELATGYVELKLILCVI